MSGIKELYRKNVYGVMGTLIFHILLVTAFCVAELKMNIKIEKEEAILLDISILDEKKETHETKTEKQQGKITTSVHQQSGSNHAVNDAPNSESTKKDRFFDENYKHDIEEAKKMVANVNKQLSKKTREVKKLEMPEATTEGQNPDSIKNIIYSGKSNIHYYLENRFHVRLPIPVYLAKNGGDIKVDIQVDRSGKVIRASVKTGRNTTDPALTEYAIEAAERTIFNSESKAPAVQYGSISYKFVAQ